jgi:hypothetical protein
MRWLLGIYAQMHVDAAAAANQMCGVVGYRKAAAADVWCMPHDCSVNPTL